MVIEIPAPVFKCAEDENVFFSRIYGLPGYDHIEGQGRNLCLTLKNHPEEAAVEELQEICNIWNTTFNAVIANGR